MAACIRQLEQWGVTRQHAGGELPVPGVYGVPAQWPHISALYERAGFRHAIGFIEVETVEEGERWSRHGGWADVGNLQVAETCRRQGIATWLLGQAADWLRLARVDRLLDYAWSQGTDPGDPDYTGYRAFLPAAGFREITRTRRGWSRAAPGTGHR